MRQSVWEQGGVSSSAGQIGNQYTGLLIGVVCIVYAGKSWHRSLVCVELANKLMAIQGDIKPGNHMSCLQAI